MVSADLPVITGYAVQRRVGGGGMGDVYEAVQNSDGSRVAVKLIRAASADAEALRREYHVLSLLEHPALARMIDFGVTSEGAPYLVMQWAEGTPLCRDAFMRADGSFDNEKFARVVLAVCDALSYIHARSLAHGDIKPANILLRDEAGVPRVTIIDFGLSRRLDEESVGLSGTAEYLAPELIRGGAPDARSDLYALGCTLYECVQGQPPFTGDGFAEVLARQLREVPPEVQAPGLDPGIATWIATLLAKDVAFRHRSAAQLATAASQYLGLQTQDALHSVGSSLRLPVVPRKQELAKLLELRAASAQRSCVAFIDGVERIGRSSLLRELRAETLLAGGAMLTVQPRAGDSPFTCVLQALRASVTGELDAEQRMEAGVVEAMFPGTFPGVEPVALSQLSDEARKLRVHYAAASLLAKTGRVRMLAIDDVHHADPFSREFFPALAAFLEANAVRDFFLLLAAVSDTADDIVSELEDLEIVTRVTLQPFSNEQMAGALRALLGKAPSQSFTMVLLRQAGGVPGNLEELLSFCLAENLLEETPHGWLAHERENLSAFFPSSLDEAYRRKISRLGDSSRAVLEAAALSAIPAEASALVATTGQDSLVVVENIAQLLEAGLLERDSSRYHIAHPAIKPLVAPDESRARSIHDAYFAWHEHAGDTDPFPRAVHAYRSSHPDTALPYLLQAAEQRRAQFDTGTAETLLTDALSLLRDPDHAAARFDVLSTLAGIVNLLGKRDAEQECLEEMLVLAAQSGKSSRLADVYRHQTEFYMSVAEFDRARKSAEKALAYSRQAGDALGEAYCHRRIGFTEYRTHPGEHVLEHYRRALEILEREHAESDAGNLLVDIGLVYYSILNDPEKAQEHFDRGRELCERAGDRRGLIRAHGNTGARLYSQGCYEPALESHTLANVTARAIGDRRFLATSFGSMAQCELALCRFSDALIHLQEELRISREIRDLYLQEMCLENLGELYLTLGEYDKSIAAYEQARRFAEQSGNSIGAIACDIDIAGGLIEKRDTDAAAKLLRNARVALEDVNDVNVDAVRLYRTGMLHLARGPLHDPARALDAFRALGDLADAHGFRSFSVLARSYAGYCLLSEGRPAEGGELSEAAIKLLDDGQPLYGGAGDVLLNHAMLLRAQRNPDAVTFVDRAHAELMRAAASIEDVHLYRTYLEQVRVNAEIIREYTLAHRGDSKDVLSAVREQNLRTLYDVARKINSVLDLPLLLDNIMDSALEAMNGERGLIFLIEEDQLVLKVSRNVEKETIEDATEISLSILRDVVAGGRPIIVADTAQNEEFRNRDSVKNYNIHSLICVPMRARDRLIGTVYVDSRSDALRAISFSDIDAEFLEAFSNLATIAIENARLHASLQEENLYLRKAVTRQYGFENIIGESAVMQRLFAETQAAITTDGAVLISGESGTGKELVAKAIHFNGARKSARFVAVDCGALPDTLLESELFGYKRGAFTGAYNDKPGLFEEAHNGTLFLDEISNTSLAFQAKLLRVLQDGEFRRVGDTATRRVNVRIICATNQNLAVEIDAGRFRQDLFYRLNVIPIDLPPLRERISDIPLLIQHFISKHAEKHNSPVIGATNELVEALQMFAWKGNIRELENLLNRMLAQASEEVLSTKHLPQDYQPSANSQHSGANQEVTVSFKGGSRLITLQQAEREHILSVLQHVKGNRTEAAKILGLKRTTLIEKMKKLGMM